MIVIYNNNHCKKKKTRRSVFAFRLQLKRKVNGSKMAAILHQRDIAVEGVAQSQMLVVLKAVELAEVVEGLVEPVA